MRRTLEVSAVIAATILIAVGFHAWLTAHDEQLRMQATIATQKQQLDAADARERARATTLDQTLAQIQKLKRDTQTPEEILKQLPQYLNLPEPITLNPSSTGDDSQAGAVSPTAVLGKIEKGTGLRVFGGNWFARYLTSASDGTSENRRLRGIPGPVPPQIPTSTPSRTKARAAANQKLRANPYRFLPPRKRPCQTSTIIHPNLRRLPTPALHSRTPPTSRGLPLRATAQPPE